MHLPFMSSAASSGGSSKLIGVGALVVVAVVGLIYSFSAFSSGDSISPVTESADGQATMRKLTCGKCGYEEEVTSAEYNDRMKNREDPNKWLECPKCHENAVQRASSGKPFGAPVVPDAPAAEPESAAPEPTQSDPEAPAQPKVGNRSQSPGS